ncbi:SgcJ/EcaC family oxidoreductase [Actinoalloteichus sp. AHMU CJ021]|uniref:SgcJ/EcaC family oxidoreductase n=1 Tax=Actinoalloteichus sp. AHMU CJ021 TaxID=2072503 RepID=UPI003FCCF808
MSSSSPRASAADQAAVAALTQRVIAAWAYHDADAFADVFTEDGTMILPGIYRKGREEIRSFLVDAYANEYRGTQVGDPVLPRRRLRERVPGHPGHRQAGGPPVPHRGHRAAPHPGRGVGRG